MKKELCYYQVKPSVVPADRESRVEIRCREERYAFPDGEKYTVTVTPHSVPQTPYSDEYLVLEPRERAESVTVTARGGVLRFSFRFCGEQKWRVLVTPHTPEKAEFLVELYSLAPDLYGLRPYKGDLHIHTTHSDGTEAPATTAANYRKSGYDFIALTDHHKFTASQEANRIYAGLDTNFVIYNGEEVHNNHMGQMHVINFDSASSVNDRILNDRENTLGEVERIRNSPELAEVFDKTDIAWRIWTYRAIQKSGGLAIFPHPYWDVCNVEHASEYTVEYVFTHGLMDAFEIFGGTSHRGNNLQAVLYGEMRARGYDYPIVASTDAHSSLEHGVSDFAIAYTVAFAENPREIRRAILAGHTVGVQTDPGQLPNLAGKLRLCKYASFLLDNYFPLHDELCFAAGQMMLRYARGDRDRAKAACEILESYLREWENDFFSADRGGES